LIIDPANIGDGTRADHEYVIQLQEWLVRDGLTFPAEPMDGMEPNYFTINGKSYPSTVDRRGVSTPIGTVTY
jgi:hypothetical protein